jgi:hypothetical protein
LGEKKDGWKIGKQHRTDDKTSPKVYYYYYYCVPYNRPSALLSINEGINIGSNEPDPPWYPVLNKWFSGRALTSPGYYLSSF